MRFAAPLSLMFFVIGHQFAEEITLPFRPADPIEEKQQAVAEVIDSFAEDEIYLVESDDPLLTVTFPEDLLQIVPFDQGTVLFSRFAGGAGSSEVRTVQKKFGYGLIASAAGAGQLVLIPAGNPARMIRQNITVTEKKGVIQPEPDLPKDDVDRAFLSYKAGWRRLQGELAEKLESGEVTSESAAADWFRSGITQVRRDAFDEILQLESIEFGGSDWSAKRHADYIRRYAE